jgi:hypothetical protein
MYNLILDKKFTEPLGNLSPSKKQNFGPSPGGTGTPLQFPSTYSDHQI